MYRLHVLMGLLYSRKCFEISYALNFECNVILG